MAIPPANTPQRNVWLTIRRLRGEEVSYRRGDLSIDLVAVPTRPDALQLDGPEQITFKSDELQFLIDPAELVDENGIQVEPQLTDTIEIKRWQTKYKVQPTQKVTEAWRWSDPLRTWRRVNTAKM